MLAWIGMTSTDAMDGTGLGASESQLVTVILDS